MKLTIFPFKGKQTLKLPRLHLFMYPYHLLQRQVNFFENCSSLPQFPLDPQYLHALSHNIFTKTITNGNSKPPALNKAGHMHKKVHSVNTHNIHHNDCERHPHGLHRLQQFNHLFAFWGIIRYIGVNFMKFYSIWLDTWGQVVEWFAKL